MCIRERDVCCLREGSDRLECATSKSCALPAAEERRASVRIGAAKSATNVADWQTQIAACTTDTKLMIGHF